MTFCEVCNKEYKNITSHNKSKKHRSNSGYTDCRKCGRDYLYSQEDEEKELCGQDICHQCVSIRKDFSGVDFSQDSLRKMCIASGVFGGSTEDRMMAYFTMNSEDRRKFDEMNAKYK